jgi:predicted metal-dependent hydrolase
MRKYIQIGNIKYYFRARRVVHRKEKRTSKNYLKYKESARGIAISRLEYFNTFYGFKYNRIAIRDQKTRWGSCSKKGNLNFNYKIALIPEKARDYIIVHELCHLGEFNHSRNFWNLVKKTVPDYLEIRRALKKIGYSLR